MSKAPRHGQFFPASRPRSVDGGIKARSARGAISQTWWSGRFISVLESMGMGSRLQRGKRYARTGQVIDLTQAAGAVTAQVQGSRARPYRVRVSITAFNKGEWARIEQALADKAWYAAQLLSGSMPEDIEDVFASAGLPLFPRTGGDLSMDCSCPDWEVPCKHLAAVCYLLAESFDEDPFRILSWRGRDREDLLDNLRALRGAGPPAPGAAVSKIAPLTESLANYFASPVPLTPHQPAEVAVDSLLRQLPEVPLEVRGHPIVALLRPAYLRMGSVGGEDA